MVFFKFDVVYMCGISLFKLVGLRLINDIVGILHNGIKYIKKNPVIATKDFMQLLKKITWVELRNYIKMCVLEK